MKQYLQEKKSNYDKSPSVEVIGFEDHFTEGWSKICEVINDKIVLLNKDKCIIVVDCYLGLHDHEIITALRNGIKHEYFINFSEALKSEEEIRQITQQDVTDDDIFGYMTRLNLADFYDKSRIESLSSNINTRKGVGIVYGIGASLIVSDYSMLIYADMPRWEGQLRFRRNEVSNLGIQNQNEKASLQYKRAFFVDWRVIDRHKKKLWEKIDFILDTVNPGKPAMITGEALLKGLEKASKRPFRVVPFFDPGPWGGQWMKEVCNLDKSKENFAWCFDCVPEENSLYLRFGNKLFEIPSINLVFKHPEELLGSAVYGRFGDEFPIRFDFLDTIGGGNLSLQVHPLTEYIQEKFGMHYTQDESYYMLEAEDDAVVYLGLKDHVVPENMIAELKEAQKTGKIFHAEKHVGVWPVKKHDHILIPAGTIHCSGKNSMVLEISATPYIFTFKLYDWGRMGLDGLPRPINIEHGKNVIQWNRTESWAKKNIVNQVCRIAEGDGWFEEKTGLHESEFIETRRHWFTKTVHHNTNGGVNVLNLIEGREVVIESPDHSFEPFIVHYAETFIIPASVGAYTITPTGESKGNKCGTIKAFIRTNP